MKTIVHIVKSLSFISAPLSFAQTSPKYSRKALSTLRNPPTSGKNWKGLIGFRVGSCVIDDGKVSGECLAETLKGEDISGADF